MFSVKVCLVSRLQRRDRIPFPCICRSSERRHSMLIHLNAFQPLSPWAAAIHLPFTRSERQKKKKPSARFRGNWTELKMRRNLPAHHEEAATAGRGWCPSPDRNVMRDIKEPSRPCANNLVHVSSPSARNDRATLLAKRAVADDGGPSPAGRLLTIYLQKTFRHCKRSQRRGAPGLFVGWAGMKREEGDAKVLLSPSHLLPDANGRSGFIRHSQFHD